MPEIVTLSNQISGWCWFLTCFLQKKHVMLFCNVLNMKKYLPSLLNYLDLLSRGQKSWLIENYWINNNQNKCKAKTCGFCMQSISHKSNQWGILKTICDDVISMLFRTITQHFFPYPLKFSFWLFTTSEFLFSLSERWSLLVRYLLTSKKLVSRSWRFLWYWIWS